MSFDRSLKGIFDRTAKLYDEVRPGHPEQLIEDVISLSGIAPGGRILEVGCGPGKATIPFAERGYAMVCVELGQELAALAAKNCRPYPAVRIQNVSFEDWPLEREAFDLVISAQAFHWIPPEIGYPKVAAALKRTGSMALFWNLYPGSDTDFFRALQKVYEREVPELAHPPAKFHPEELIASTSREICDSGLFGEVVVKRYPWSERYTTEQYLKLLNTYSNHLNLPDERRRGLFQGVGELIDQFGGVLERPYLAVLLWARVLNESG